jgi:hypothetical protein
VTPTCSRTTERNCASASRWFVTWLANALGDPLMCLAGAVADPLLERGRYVVTFGAA